LGAGGVLGDAEEQHRVDHRHDDAPRVGDDATDARTRIIGATVIPLA
jgi:hypothetical protein